MVAKLGAPTLYCFILIHTRFIPFHLKYTNLSQNTSYNGVTISVNFKDSQLTHVVITSAYFLSSWTPMEYINKFTLQPDLQVKQLFRRLLKPLCNTKCGQACLPIISGK